MSTRLILLSAAVGGLALGGLLSQGVPVSPRSPDKPAWRALVQAQYTQPSRYSYSRGPEDVTVSAGAPLLADNAGAAQRLPPEYAAAERSVREAARAAADARYHLAQATASTPDESPDDPQAGAIAPNDTAPADPPRPRVIDLAALGDRPST